MAYSNLDRAFGNTQRIDGFDGDVMTWGGSLKWTYTEVCKDNSVVDSKRDHYEKRSDFCFKVAEAGAFEWCVGFVVDANNLKRRTCKCKLCGALHNWCVFYRDAVTKAFLGYSGVDCFGELCNNLRLPNSEAVFKTACAERSRSEKFRKTMAKVNDFKRDFPGIYEHRDTLKLYKLNPYAFFINIVLDRVNKGNGVDEKWLNGCLDGTVVPRDFRAKKCEVLKRLPGFLKWLSNSSTAAHGALPVVLDLLTKCQAVEKEDSFFAKRTPFNRLPSEVVAKGRYLLENGMDWSIVARRAANGQALTEKEVSFVNEEYAKRVGG